MEILQNFIFDHTEHAVTILWENDEPLFRASEIGDILDIKNIHTSIDTYDSNEKVLRSMDTLGGPQEVLFLTEVGVYRLLMLSRKPIARPFQIWVTQVIKEINAKN